MPFIDKLLEIMKERNVSAYRLSKDLGFSDSIISKWQKNPNISPSAGTVLKISEYFQIPMERLLAEEDFARLKKDIDPVPKSGEVVLMAKGYGGKSETITLSEKDYELAKSLFERFRSNNETEKRD